MFLRCDLAFSVLYSILLFISSSHDSSALFKHGYDWSFLLNPLYNYSLCQFLDSIVTLLPHCLRQWYVQLWFLRCGWENYIHTERHSPVLAIWWQIICKCPFPAMANLVMNVKHCESRLVANVNWVRWRTLNGISNNSIRKMKFDKCFSECYVE